MLDEGIGFPHLSLPSFSFLEEAQIVNSGTDTRGEGNDQPGGGRSNSSQSLSKEERKERDGEARKRSRGGPRTSCLVRADGLPETDFR